MRKKPTKIYINNLYEIKGSKGLISLVFNSRLIFNNNVLEPDPNQHLRQVKISMKLRKFQELEEKNPTAH